MKKIRKWIIISEDGNYVCANNNYKYTDNIDNACVWYDRSEAVIEKTEPGERVVEVTTKNTLVKQKSQADVIEKLLKKAREKPTENKLKVGQIFKEKNGGHNFVEVVSLSIQDYVKIKIIENSYPGGSITTVRRDMFHFEPCSKGYYYYGRKK